MNRLLLIADDFTGALDTGIQFVKRSIHTEVFADDRDFPAYKGDADVLVVNSNTRNASADTAYDRVRAIVTAGIAAGATCFYKKTDSALRGNIGSELQAVMDGVSQACGKACTMHFVPAMPKMNRVTRNGIQYIDGIPVAESEFARDKYSPVTKSAVSEIIGEQSGLPVYVHTGAEAGMETNGTEACAKAGMEIGEEAGIHVYDAGTARDLEDIAESIRQKGTYRLLAGCAGFADVVPQLLGLTGNISDRIDLIPGLIVVCGSTNKITQDQLAYAEQKGFVRINLHPEQVLNPAWISGADCEKILDKIERAYKETGKIIIDTNDAEPGIMAAYADAHGLAREEIRTGISGTLGSLLKKLLDRGARGTLLLTGGDTLLGFMKCINTMRLTPVGEVDAGVVLSRVRYDGTDYPVISKSGGFGKKELLADLAGRIDI